MKMIVKQYLSSLNERDELDAILPSLLSQLGLNVYSQPGRGTRQYGVDVAAVGKLDGNTEKVYLFSIKPGDLTRDSWDGNPQALRSSLNEILDFYITSHLPDEHKNKEIVVCLCFGGDIQEQVRSNVTGYISKHKRDNLAFEEWNGDKLASLILSSFLHEDLLPTHARSQLRKSLAMLDEPAMSYKHFSELICSLSSMETTKDESKVRVIRQINICLWILFAWARDEGNVEASYLSSELALLNTWNIAKAYSEEDTEMAYEIQSAFFSVLNVYQKVSAQFLDKKILPHACKRHALSDAVKSPCGLDVNLKLFDTLGRLAIGGIWAHWFRERCSAEEHEASQHFLKKFHQCSSAIIEMVKNNTALLLPIKDDQAIDLSMAVLLLILEERNHSGIKGWLFELVDRAEFAYKVHGQYPCILQKYNELLVHPKCNDDAYFKEVTGGSILFPLIALWAALLDENEIYDKVQAIKRNHLQHCTFQFWYPDDVSEEYFYTNNGRHGSALTDVCIDRSRSELLNQAFGECEHSPCENLSAIKNGLYPLLLVACRHYRMPVPVHFWKKILKKNADESNNL